MIMFMFIFVSIFPELDTMHIVISSIALPVAVFDVPTRMLFVAFAKTITTPKIISSLVTPSDYFPGAGCHPHCDGGCCPPTYHLPCPYMKIIIGCFLRAGAIQREKL